MQRLTGLDAAFLVTRDAVGPHAGHGRRGRRPDHVRCRGSRSRARARAAGVSPAPVPPFRRRLVEVPFGLHVPSGSRTPTSTSTTTCAAPRCRRPAVSTSSPRSWPTSRPAARPHAAALGGVGRRGSRPRLLRVHREVHHSLIDGVSGVEILASLFDLEPDPEPQGHRHRAGVGARARAERRRAAVVRRAVVRVAAGAVREGGEQPRAERRPRRSQRARERELDVPLPLTAPRLSMNRSITPHRKVAFASVPLADDQGGEERARRHGERRRARGHRRRAPQLPDRARRAARRSLVAAIPRTSAPRTSVSSATGSRRCSRRCRSRSRTRSPASQPSRARRRGGSRSTRRSAPPRSQDWAGVAAPAVFSRAIRLYGRLRLG